MKITACYSIKGGVGKTACSVNLAWVTANAGLRTLLVDLDPQGASSYYFRVRPAKKFKPKSFFTLSSVLEASIRGSDYENLDILPASLNYRKFDALLGNMKNSRARLRKSLKKMAGQYDMVILDCPPSIGVLSENVFVAADVIIVPVIPTTLSERTFEKLLDFFTKSGYSSNRIHGFFSMVQGNNRLHRETMERMRDRHNSFLETVIPVSSEIERMGVHREPVLCYAPSNSGAQAYKKLCDEILDILSKTDTAEK